MTRFPSIASPSTQLFLINGGAPKRGVELQSVAKNAGFSKSSCESGLAYLRNKKTNDILDELMLARCFVQ